jgi:hypothetical protein
MHLVDKHTRVLRGSKAQFLQAAVSNAKVHSQAHGTANKWYVTQWVW